MNGQMMSYSRYYESLKSMPEPIMPSQLPKVKMDINEIVQYARSKGKKVAEMTEEELEKFITRY